MQPDLMNRVAFFSALLLQTNIAVGISHIADGSTLRALFACSESFSLSLNAGCENCSLLSDLPPLPEGGRNPKDFRGDFEMENYRRRWKDSKRVGMELRHYNILLCHFYKQKNCHFTNKTIDTKMFPML